MDDPMAPIRNRLAQLRTDYEAGEAQLRALGERRDQLQNTMLRISGAIQVLEDVLAGSSAQ